MQDWLETPIRTLNEAVIQAEENHPTALRLMEHRAAGPVAALECA